MLHILTTYRYERVSTFFKLKLNLFEKFKFKGNYVGFFFFSSKQGFLRKIQFEGNC